MEHFSLGEVLGDISGKEPLYLAKKFKAQYTAVKEIPVPVIGVGAVYGSYQTAEIMLQLKSVISRFSKVLTIYSRDGLTETGAFCISPAEMQNLSFEDRIKYINWYINKVVEKEHPDVVCIEVPGGLARLNNTILNGGGEYPFIYGQAVSPDYFVCSVLLDFSSQEKLLSLKEILERQYAFSNISFHLSNVFLPVEELHRGPGQMLSCIMEDSDAVEKTLRRLRQNGLDNCYNFLNGEDVLKWGECL